MRWLLVPLLLLSMAWAHAGQVTAKDAWVREVPATSRHSAGYLTLENSGSEDSVLVAVESRQFKSAMLHQTTDVDGMARMRHINHIKIPAGGRVRLAPLGLHVMLMNRVPESLVAGDRVQLTLRFDDGSTLAVDALVSRDVPDEHAPGQHH